MIRTIFYDTETTGLVESEDRIIEIAAYDPISNKSFSSLVNPNRSIPKEAEAVHHINDEMVKQAPIFKEVAKDFFQFCSGEVLLIAHNNDAFDQPFLQKELGRAGLEMPRSIKFLDSLKWARKYRKDLPRHSLQYLREIFEIPANNAHRALDDVMTLYQVFSHMTDDLDPNTIHALLYPTCDRFVMPFGKHKGKQLREVPRHYLNWLHENKILEKEENKTLLSELIELGLIERNI